MLPMNSALICLRAWPDGYQMSLWLTCSCSCAPACRVAGSCGGSAKLLKDISAPQPRSASKRGSTPSRTHPIHAAVSFAHACPRSAIYRGVGGGWERVTRLFPFWHPWPRKKAKKKKRYRNHVTREVWDPTRVLRGIPGECGCGAGRRLGGAERTTATQSEFSDSLCRHGAREIVPRGRAQPAGFEAGPCPIRARG